MDKWQEIQNAREKTEKLKKSNKKKDHEKILEMLKDAGNQIGVFDGIFSGFSAASESFIKYIVPKVIEHQYYRYRCVTDNVAWSFGLNFPINDSKKFFNMVNDILSGNFKKFLDTKDISVVYTLLVLLPLADKKVYSAYFQDALVSPDKDKRFIALYYTSRFRKDKLSLCNAHFQQDDLELMTPLMDCIPSFMVHMHKERQYKAEGNGKTEEALFYKLCEFQARLPQKNIVYQTDEKIWFQRGTGRREISDKIFYLLLVLKNKKLIRFFEEKHYAQLDAEEKIKFINLFASALKLNCRREMLNYFSYKERSYYGENQTEKYFLSNPLSFEEAVAVSDFLKTKKTDIKKHIVEHFLKMTVSDQVKLKAYLEKAQEDYKQEAAKDLAGSKNPVNIAVPSVQPQTYKIAKITLPDLCENQAVDCFERMKEFVIQNKDFQYKGCSGEDVLFGEVYQMLNDETGHPLQNETDELIKSFCLSPQDTISFEYALRLMYVSYGYRFETTTVGRRFDGIARADENQRLSQHYFIPMLKHAIETSNSADIQKARVERFIGTLDEIKVLPKIKETKQVRSGREADKQPEPMWRRLIEIAFALNEDIDYGLLDRETLKIYADVFLSVQNVSYLVHIFRDSQEVFAHLFDKGIMTKAEIIDILKKGKIDITDVLVKPSEFWQGKRKNCYLYSGKFSQQYIDFIERFVMSMLDVEIERNQAETVYSRRIAHCAKLFGIRYYLKALQGFQKMTLPRASYGWGMTKDQVFAKIVQASIPYKTDTFEEFEKLTGELRLSDKDLVKGALFNNNRSILEWTDKLLKKKGFIGTVMFFKAHLRDSDVSESVRNEIAAYSPVDILDFKEGAVDVNWFWNIKKEADDKTFRLVYDNAKYITVANYHKRAQRFHDALTNVLTKEECLEKINATRNKEFLLYYSLIPLVGEKDVDERYALIMRFLQESKQFGAQRQASEKKACEIALENLARVSGYEDTNRFVWFMESKAADRIAPYFVPKELGDLQIYLSISDRFKVSLAASKNGKEMASIPASLKNDAYVAELKAEIPALNKQSSRVVKSLETAMERESVFTIEELETIAKSPLIKRILNALFFAAGSKIYTFAELILSGEDKCVIAHPLDFLRLNVWAEKQKFLLSNAIRQPFKQAFREVYPKTDDEKDAKETNRYAGCQISVQKAIAVAKNRGWHTGEDIGLQKVFYKENIVAVLFGVWDFGYSSFDDSPTISSVYFLNRKADESGAMKIVPLNEINDKMFSEVMRDIDLIVSTSHPQGYDFEESLSTVEVRRQICRNVAELLNLQNISFSGNFVRVNNALGEFDVNLRSAVISKQLSGALNIMAINDSTQNKLFLNFIDDNPVTVEVISKMLLLSDEKKIKDINILREMKK